VWGVVGSFGGGGCLGGEGGGVGRWAGGLAWLWFQLVWGGAIFKGSCIGVGLSPLVELGGGRRRGVFVSGFPWGRAFGCFIRVFGGWDRGQLLCSLFFGWCLYLFGVGRGGWGLLWVKGMGLCGFSVGVGEVVGGFEGRGWGGF